MTLALPGAPTLTSRVIWKNLTSVPPPVSPPVSGGVVGVVLVPGSVEIELEDEDELEDAVEEPPPPVPPVESVLSALPLPPVICCSKGLRASNWSRRWW